MPATAALTAEAAGEAGEAGAKAPAREPRPPRACVGRARQLIRDTLDWENCDEDSGQFRSAAQRLDEAFFNEDLEEAEMEEVSSSGPDASGSKSEDELYESSFVDDGSESEREDSEDEWWPLKRPCCAARHLAEAPSEDEEEAAEAAADGAPAADEADAASAADEADAASAADAVSAADEADSYAAPAAVAASFLHAEELNSPPGFYNLWVL